MKIRAIVTGATGMVGEGVLYECLNNPEVEAVLVIGRKPCGYTHFKMKEIIHSNFFELTSLESELQGYNACYFALGVSSVGMKEDEYTRLTYDLTLNFAKTLARINTDMTFCYVSGGGTDSTEKGKSMWARVKGRTENDLMKLPFKNSFMFRPGYMHPTPGLKNTLQYYKYLSWMYPFFKIIFPGFVSKLRDLGRAMIYVTLNGNESRILEVKDINRAGAAL